MFLEKEKNFPLPDSVQPMNMRLIALLFALPALLGLQSCLEEPPGSEWQKPPRYGHGGTESRKKKPTPPPKKENRFGYSGDDAGAPPPTAGGSGPTTDRERDIEPIDTAGTGETEKEATEKKEGGTGGKPDPSNMPFAQGVPGDPLQVRIPGRDDLPAISIEQGTSGKPLPPGTPVSIPDPSNPGKEIYFKVP